MITVDQLLGDKERELEDYLARLDDPPLRRILSDISALRRAKELMLASGPQKIASSPATTQNGNGIKAVPVVMAQGDIAEQILAKAGRPVSVDEMLREAKARFELSTPKENFVSALRKDRRKRFSVIREIVSLRGAKSTGGHTSNNGGNGPLAQLGFSLVGSIKELLPTFHGEITQPAIYNALREKYPNVAHLIQKASIATTLRKLEKDGFIEMTYKGFGSEPRRYKRLK